jgi:DNA end-binding protein Ku
MVKGYEVAKGRYVTFSARELEALEQVSTQTIEIEEFLPAEAIDPIYFAKAYYLGPDKAGAKAYRLLTQVLRKAARVALGRYAARGKQYLVLLRASGESLVLHELHHRDELRKPVEIPRGEASVKPSELRLAERLVEQTEGETFRPERYRTRSATACEHDPQEGRRQGGHRFSTREPQRPSDRPDGSPQGEPGTQVPDGESRGTAGEALHWRRNSPSCITPTTRRQVIAV